MASQLADTQIIAKQRLQQIISSMVAAAWTQLPHYNQEQVDQFLSTVIPVTAAANRQSVMLTEAFLARALGRLPVGVNADQIVAGIRNGTTPEQVYKRPFVTVWSALGKGTPWEQAVRMGRDRATSAAMTDVQLSFTHTLQAVGTSDDRITGYERVPDAGACEFCQTAAGQIYHTDNLMPLHDRCVTGDTRVWSPPARLSAETSNLRGAQAVTRRWYTGEIVVLLTAAGRQVTVTPNHPVLTESGWVAAHLLREGDSVVSYAGPGGIDGSVPNEQNMPARIEERFGASTVVPESVPFSTEHFHGDIGDGQVDVVAANGKLDPWTLATLLQPRQQPLLTFGCGEPACLHRLCPNQRFALGADSTTSGSIRRHRALAPFRLRLSCSTYDHLPRSGAHRYPSEDQVTPDRAPVNPVALRERQHRFPGEISLDSIRHARRIRWSGQVFNLVTEAGWYIANGIVTHNCACGVEPVTEPVEHAAPTHFSGPDDLEVAVHDHGELGPVLTNAADHFTTESVALGHH